MPLCSILFEIIIPELCPEQFCKLPDIFSVIAVFRKFNRVLPEYQLCISGVYRLGKFFYLVSGIVYIEFSGYFISRSFENGCERISQNTAPGVAHMHRTGRICGYKFYYYFSAVSFI